MEKSKGRAITLDAVNLRERYLTEQQAAALLSLSTSTLQKDRMGITKLKIPYVKIGIRVRYIESDLHRYMQEHRIETEGRVK